MSSSFSSSLSTNSTFHSLLPLLFSSLYVFSLYLFPQPKPPSSYSTNNLNHHYVPSLPLPRDHPKIIKKRLKGLSIALFISLSLFNWLIPNDLDLNSPTNNKHHHPFFSLLGLSLPSTTLTSLITFLTLPLLLTSSLFLGPLYSQYLYSSLPGMKNFHWRDELGEMFGSWKGWRDYVLGPLTEELVFRSCIIASTLLSSHLHSKNQQVTNTPGSGSGLAVGVDVDVENEIRFGTASSKAPGKAFLVFVTPLYFGVAHLHHLIEHYVQSGRTRDVLIVGIVRCLFQFTYTTLFGWYAAFLFIRTGSIIPPLLSHTFCNLMGFPDLMGQIQRHPNRKWAIIIIYFLGVYLFYRNLFPWTEPTRYNENGSIYWQ